MPFKRMQEAIALAAGLDSALSRRGETGMEMVRSAMPELRDLIDEVNAALHEVDDLLFSGLRDEAVALNDPDFPRVAARLNLEDREAWPQVQAFFEREGIPPPPRIDFDTLAALDSAHAELEVLAKPLDRLRRQVLSRAPLVDRLRLLRKVHDFDPTKPVWADAVKEHELARLTEVAHDVKRALAARDPAEIAALHAELVAPDWTVAVPGDLVRSTRGADVWGRLREALQAADGAAAALERGLALVEQDADTDTVAGQRHARHQWREAAAAVQECLGGLDECPRVAELIAAEGLADRFAALEQRVQPALAWLQAHDDHEALLAWQAQSLAQIDRHLAGLPRSAREEPQWLAGITVLAAKLQERGMLPADVAVRVEDAVALVRQAPQRRLVRNLVAAAAVVIVAAIIVACWLSLGTQDEPDDSDEVACGTRGRAVASAAPGMPHGSAGS